jgi:ADP-ribose pyrophosphatase
VSDDGAPELPRPLPTVLSAERVLSTQLIDVDRDRIRFPDGHEAERIVVRHPGAVAIVALDEEGRWLLVRQYRHPARRVLLEVPAGTLEPGEEPDRTAARELREETGFAAAELERIGGFYTAPGFCDEYIHLFLARGLTADPLPQDQDEYIEDPIALSPVAVARAAAAGEIEDAKTLSALALLGVRGEPGAPPR